MDPTLTVTVGDKVTIGGPKSDNFLPDTWMDVYVVPHRIWQDGASLKADAVHRGRVRSNAKGQLPLTQLWVPDRAGQFDIIVDYDGDGKFSYALDALDRDRRPREEVRPNAFESSRHTACAVASHRGEATAHAVCLLL